MRNAVKKMLPPNIYGGLKTLYSFYKNNTLVKNFYNTNHAKNVLISYIVRPFKKGVSLTHTNHAEALRIAQAFDELNYNVDVINFNSNRILDYNKYDIVFGFGEPVERSFCARTHSILTIYYGTGMHIFEQNCSTLKRIKDTYIETGKYFLNSARIVEKTWSVQTALVDAIITLGDAVTVASYRKYYAGPIFNIPASYYEIIDFTNILEEKNFSQAKRHYLWFGGGGLIHKGLDLLLEVFKNKPDLHLHICGRIDNEPEFKACFYDELYNKENIHTHGFVHLRSELFAYLIKTCAFVIFPSCSEGQATSVINVMGNGALLPIVTKESGIPINDYGIEIKACDVKAVTQAIEKAKQMTIADMKEKSFLCGQYITKRHLIASFSEVLREALKKTLSIWQY